MRLESILTIQYLSFGKKPNDPYIITLEQVELENIEPEVDVKLETQIASIESQIKQGEL